MRTLVAQTASLPGRRTVLGPGLLLLWALSLPFLSLRVNALIQTGKGNSPVTDPGWPAGALTVANLDSRIGWMEGPPFGGGQWTFFYRSDTGALQRALDAFAAIEAERLEIILHEGTVTSEFLKLGDPDNSDTHYDWSFEVWVPENWQRLFNNPQSFFSADHPNFRQPVAAPRLEIWLLAGRVEWERIKVPPRVMVEDARATSHGFNPGSGSAIRAKVSDAETGGPIEAARLVVAANRDGKGFKRVTEARGTGSGLVELSGLSNGTYQIVATASGYVPRVLGYARFGSNDFKEFAVMLSRLAALKGQVLDEAERPLSGVTIKAMNTLGPDGHGYPMPEAAEAVSDSQGRFQLSGLPVGSSQIWAYGPGYHHRWRPSELVRAVPTEKADSAGHIVRMEATGKVRIQLVDANGTAIKQLQEGEAHVHIQSAEGAVVGSWGGSANVSTNGQYEFEDVPPGQYRVSGKPFIPGQSQPHDRASLVTVEARKRQ